MSNLTEKISDLASSAVLADPPQVTRSTYQGLTRKFPHDRRLERYNSYSRHSIGDVAGKGARYLRGLQSAAIVI